MRVDIEKLIEILTPEQQVTLRVNAERGPVPAEAFSGEGEFNDPKEVIRKVWEAGQGLRAEQEYVRAVMTRGIPGRREG